MQFFEEEMSAITTFIDLLHTYKQQQKVLYWTKDSSMEIQYKKFYLEWQFSFNLK